MFKFRADQNRAASALWLLTAVLIHWCAQAALAADVAAGRDLFFQHCAKCHGKQGEGVKGEYGRALQGDWSVEKLARVITETMPDEMPEQCVEPEASAVARYIYDAFYSLEARARNTPPRVELARLTKRQYLNTVADLFQRFNRTDREPSPGKAHGLRATYYNSKNFSGNKKVEERVDRQVDFDYALASPIPGRIGTNEFAMQWRGAVWAEETGDYEFIVKTPNGARLWVNDDQTPIIDAWVASGRRDEHRARVRLLGGRAYPLRLDFYKSIGKLKTNLVASIALQWQPPHGVRQTIPARHLRPRQTQPTLVITTPFPADDSSVGYERGVSVSKAWDEATTQAAIEVAHYVLQHLDTLAHTRANDARRAAKIKTFCREWVATAFRRPLRQELERAYVTARFQAAGDLEEAVKRVVLLTLKSPRFLYLGLDDSRPDDYTVAARLAFGLWDSLPDRPLLQAAAQGKLNSRDAVMRQARRMLGDARARSKMRHFLFHWLQVDHFEDLSKDDTLFPKFTSEIIADLRTSLTVFLDAVVWSNRSDYRELLRADYLYLNGRLARFYGLKVPADDGFARVTVAGQPRAGVLTHPYLLAAFAYPKSTSPIHRGVFLTRNIVGRALKPPPKAVAFKDADFDPHLTMREKVAELTRPQACQVCHAVINPLGFSLEQFDAVGRFRTREQARPINAVSDYPLDNGQTIRLTGPRDVAGFAVRSESAQKAFIEQLFHAVVKQPMLAYGGDTPDRLRTAFLKSNFNIQQLLMEIVTVSALHGLDHSVPKNQDS